MELDVRLSRERDEPWGFRLIGGVDFAMPLTVVKVLPNTPAEKAGLHNGDIVSSINDENASTMSHEDSRAAVAAAVDWLTLGVVRGLYDPVLDDYEPLYEPIDQEDSDQPSLPTEVPDPSTDICPELNNLLQPIHFNGIDPTSLGPDDFDKSFSRSLTASPYVGQAKPFRPFSTEPQEIPPLEEPIILNPDYHDVFKAFGIDDDYLPKTRFKLPISEQYDPDRSKQKMKIGKEVCENVESHVKEITETIVKQEATLTEEMKKEVDLKTIEKTATSIVKDSLEKAVTVAEEIKREIDVELHEVSLNSSEIVESSTKCDITATTTEIVDSNSVTATVVDKLEDKSIIESKQESVNIEFKDAAKEVSELVNLIDKTTEQITNQNESYVEISEIKQLGEEKQGIIQKKLFQPEIKPKVKEEVIPKTLTQPEIKSKEKQGVIQKKLFQPFVNKKDKEEMQTVALEKTSVSQSEVVKKEISAEMAITKEESASIKKEVSKTETAVKVEESTESIQTAVFKGVSEVRSDAKEEVLIIGEVKAVTDETSHAIAHTEIMKQKQETSVLQLAADDDSKLAKMTETHKDIKNEMEINGSKLVFETETKIDQESTFVAKTVEKEADKQQKLMLQTDLPKEKSDENNNTPTPTSTVPPTPLTDEYIFKLEIPLPKRSGTPIPRDCTPTPEDEDPNIVKKKFLPYIDTKIEDEIKYDPPLKSPPTSPKYTKPGLRGGADKPEYTKEEILEIERKSSLLATAIDQTIKSIEEYKEEVGIKEQAPDNNVERVEVTNESNGVVYNGYAKIVETTFYDTNLNTTNNTITDTTVPKIEMNGTNMNSKQDTVIEVATTVQDTSVVEGTTQKIEDSRDSIEGYRQVTFNPDELQDVIQEQRQARIAGIPILSQSQERELYKSASGELLGTVHGIVDGLEEAVVEPKIA
ncbi:uncharacterized protein LOC113239285, partial [Hyposmocoma kahamanoa]|uniref:uncharacterized protein LOC113239285 n=1 Tax=Hyposmocoma kahamanoa TaxID=1477025 RepID=UPI000E6D9E7B